MDWDVVEGAVADTASPAGRILAGFERLVAVRKRVPQLHAAVESQVIASPDPRLLVLLRDHPAGTMVQVYNFSEAPVYLATDAVRHFVGSSAREELSGHDWSLAPASVLVQPYQALWFTWTSA